MDSLAPEKFSFFWKGPFSQWFPCVFAVDGETYNCAEQYMMRAKAMLFGDADRAALIMAEDAPARQKALGRQVRGFEERAWEENATGIVRAGNLAKFSQNQALGEMLAATRGSTLVEASPYDAIWGIGLGASDPRALSRATWRGRNLLGDVLTWVRVELFGE